MAAFVSFIGFPKEAKIYVDGIEIGEIPLYNHMMKWGSYQIVAEKEGYIPEMRKDFTIFASDKSKTILFQLKKIMSEE